jgi:ABC-type uncharacterized transport system fused permease/ATPase subunit
MIQKLILRAKGALKLIENPQLQLAYDYVQFTGAHVFLTGKAGTGKTTFLRSLKDRC